MVQEMKYKNLLIDLDGTIIDSADGVINSFRHALDCMGVSYGDRSSMIKYMGPPLSESFSEYFDTPEEVKAAIEKYRERYSVIGWKEATLFPGIDKMLAALKEAGFGIYMATSKPEGYAVKIAENLGVAEYFDRMFGASFDGKINTKEEVLEYALNTIYGGKYDREVNRDVLMIGDRYFDVRGAAFFGIPTLGVTFGYGSEEELREAGAADTVPTAEDVVKWVMSH